jgi:hypothetical protein
VPDAPGLEKVNSLLSTTSYLSIEEVKTGEDFKDKQPKKEKESPFFIVQNPARVIPAQVKFLSLSRSSNGRAGYPGSPSSHDASGMDVVNEAVPSMNNAPPLSASQAANLANLANNRYLPVDMGRREKPYGIVMLMDKTPEADPDTDVQRVVRISLGKYILESRKECGYRHR